MFPEALRSSKIPVGSFPWRDALSFCKEFVSNAERDWFRRWPHPPGGQVINSFPEMENKKLLEIGKNQCHLTKIAIQKTYLSLHCTCWELYADRTILVFKNIISTTINFFWWKRLHYICLSSKENSQGCATWVDKKRWLTLRQHTLPTHIML